MRKVAFAHEKWLVNKKAVDPADAFFDLTEQFTRYYGFVVISFNLAALAVLATIGDGTDRFTVDDRRNFLGIKSASVPECVPLLAPAVRRKLSIDKDHVKSAGPEIHPDADQLGHLEEIYDPRRFGTTKALMAWRI